MALFNDFPYTNFHELNLDWIIKNMRILADKLERMGTGRETRRFYGARALLVGDNLAYGQGSTAGQGWPYWLTKELSLNSRTIWQVGGGFRTQATSSLASYHGKNFLEAIEADAQSVSYADRMATELIVLAGGQNDSGTSNLRLAVESLISSVKLLYPNAAIMVFPICGPANSITKTQLDHYVVIGEAAAHMATATWPDAFKWLLSRTSDFVSETDEAMPSEEGYQYLGAYMAACFQGWDGEIIASLYNFTWPENTSGLADGVNDNGMVTLHLQATVTDAGPGADRTILVITEPTGHPGRVTPCIGVISGNPGGRRVTDILVYPDGRVTIPGDTISEYDGTVIVNAMLNYPVYYY